MSIYFFNDDHDVDPAELGGKGFGLAEMTRLGMPVPRGFTIGASACRTYLTTGAFPDEAVKLAFTRLGAERVAIRSGASVSMPGMMDTKLNVDASSWMSCLNAIVQVMASWNSEPAKKYRHQHGIPEELGTAVTVQLMVDGRGPNSGVGVAFSRDPITGERVLFGEYLEDAIGDEIVQGMRQPNPLPASVLTELGMYAMALERHFSDLQDIEFVVDDGKLWLLQTRLGMRSPQAAVRIAVEMVAEGLIDRETALKRVTPPLIRPLMMPVIDPTAQPELIAEGFGACPGVAHGQVVLEADEAERRGRKEPIILVRPETSPADVGGIMSARGILTRIGGATSHAALIARAMGKPSVVGIGDELEVEHNQFITIDGSSGRVYRGAVPTVPPQQSEHLKTFLGWVEAL